MPTVDVRFWTGLKKGLRAAWTGMDRVGSSATKRLTGPRKVRKTKVVRSFLLVCFYLDAGVYRFSEEIEESCGGDGVGEGGEWGNGRISVRIWEQLRSLSSRRVC